MDEQPKKIFDIIPPKAPEPSGPKGAPTIAELAAQPHKLMTSAPKKDEPATLVDTTPDPEAAPITRKGNNITPPKNSDITESTAEGSKAPEPAVNNMPESESATEKDTTATEPDKSEEVENNRVEEETQTQEHEDKQTIITEPFGAVDGLPDMSEKAAADAKEAMQTPKIFDTNAYYVPIGNTRHTHGHIKGSIVAGLVAVTAVIGALLFFIQFKS